MTAPVPQRIRHKQRLARWERSTSMPMLLAATAFLGAYAWPIL